MIRQSRPLRAGMTALAVAMISLIPGKSVVQAQYSANPRFTQSAYGPTIQPSSTQSAAGVSRVIHRVTGYVTGNEASVIERPAAQQTTATRYRRVQSQSPVPNDGRPIVEGSAPANRMRVSPGRSPITSQPRAGKPAARTASPAATPRVQRRVQQPAPSRTPEPIIIESQESQDGFVEISPSGSFGETIQYDNTCGDGHCGSCTSCQSNYASGFSCDHCGDFCGGTCGAMCGFGGVMPLLPFITLENTTVYAGVQGFKNSPNLNADGSFGFHEGVNYGGPLPLIPESGLGWQVGFRAVHSDLSGTGFTTEQRNQTFFTTGVFKRNGCGWQGGVVFDLLRDSWYDNVDLTQVRGEISWKAPCRDEWGYWFAAGDRTDTSASPITNGQVDVWEPTNLHAFFYRRRFNFLPGATGRLYVGFSERHDGLVGVDSNIPFNERWSMSSGFSYLVPDEATGAGGGLNEGWNLGITLVYHFGHNAIGSPSPYRPLFDVADNGNFYVDRIATQ
ncbi:MAG: hypothetical protein KDA60_15110 [Planctomycetales bacterium]|nr:hypothetical protein [Planctomycetales bacterium]